MAKVARFPGWRHMTAAQRYNARKDAIFDDARRRAAMKKHPMQPVIRASDDVIRFQANKIVQWLFDSGKLNLNEIACMSFDDDDRMQIAQLLGYSVSGFGELPYADSSVVADADAKAAALIKTGE